MLFCGKYKQKPENGVINMSHKMCKETYEVICAVEPIGVTFVAVCAMTSDFRTEMREHCEILSESICEIEDSLQLPAPFVEYIGGSKVVVIGCGDRLEIYKEEEYVCPISSAEAIKIGEMALEKFEDSDI